MSLRILHVIFAAVLSAPAFAGAGTVSFSRDVLPILSDNCFGCHGPDESHRSADLRLDTHDGALQVIQPGKPDAGEFIARILSDDPEEVMPPPKSHKPKLSTAQIDTLKRWINEGAKWGKHWAFEKPVKLATSGHPVDYFVQKQLTEAGLTPSKQAPPHTLLRRLSFALTGLPPPLSSDIQHSSLEVTIDRLLASPHFGERMAMWWLDAARYSDTDGFQSDSTRTNWPWRDYVVDSFNANKPFDQFTLEQFAGDLLPNATPEQKLATCFHRNHMTNGEGGRDKEESRIDYVLDRVNTTGTTWLGLTLGCTQCHTHKFDPITHADYYSLTAFFNSIDEDGSAGTKAKPYMSYTSPYAKRAVSEAQQLVEQRKPVEQRARKDAEVPFAAWLKNREAEVKKGFTAWKTVQSIRLESEEGTVLKQHGDGRITAEGSNPKQDDYRLVATPRLPRIAGLKLEVLPANGRLSRGKSGEFILTDIKVQVQQKGSTQVQDIAVARAVANKEAEGKVRQYGEVAGTLDDDPRNGWTTKGHPQDATYTALYELNEPLILADDEELIFVMHHRSTDGDANIASFRLSVTDQRGPAVREFGPAPLEQLAAGKPAHERLFAQFLEDYAPYQEAKAYLERAEAQLKEVTAAAGKLNVQVLAERKEPRVTQVLLRGVWDKKGEEVKHDVPSAISPWPEGAPRDRLGLAKWITSRDNPLTARVTVNHIWQMLFGAGLVRTPDDFGLQGQRPTHPELLDWLAVDFMDSGWNIKHLIKRIVTSATYQQDSKADPKLVARDPDNKLLARGPRFRLPAWMIRDAALAASGLMNPALGGPPVRPHQPEGVWEEIFMGRFTYEPSQGAAQYRRTLYSFWRRSIAPTFLFDSAQRRVCEVGMTRTNTPLQALTLLNDQTMREASQNLARTALLQGDDDSRLTFITKAVLSRDPTQTEIAVLRRELERARKHYNDSPNDAASYLGVKEQAASHTDLAALTVVASLAFNLDEAITQE